MVAQADRREGAVTQAIPIAFVAALVSAGLLLVVFLDNPYTGRNGSIKPTEMFRTLMRIDNVSQCPATVKIVPSGFFSLRLLAATFCATSRGLNCQAVGRVQVVCVAVAAAG